MGLLDLIFPRYCVGCKRLGSYLCVGCESKIEYLENQVCSYCYKSALSGKTHPFCQKRFGIDGIISLTVYKTPVRELIKSLKYNFTTDLLKEFSEKFKFDNSLVTSRNWIIVPLPLHQSRANHRGFNQAELLGKIVAEKLKLGFSSQLLIREANTSSQVGLSQKDRAANVREAFRIKQTPDGEVYFIFDDVWTSGASLKEAAKVLKKAGAKEVWGLTLAHPR